MKRLVASSLALAIALTSSIAQADEVQKFKPLPEAVASFGGVVCDGALYVYSGHTGRAHDHSKHNLSQHFRRITLDGQGGWEELPFQTPLQGLPLVAHAGKIYRVGGLRALNDDVDSPDLHSSDEFVLFQPKSKQWQTLTKLHSGRSSHDAVVMGEKLYVVGGWKLNRGEEGEWYDHALCCDLTESPISWQQIPVPFQRRAPAVSQASGELYVIGGMDSDHDVSRAVNVYDPTTKQWTEGPTLPGEGMNGFGVSAWNLHGQLFVSGSGGDVYRLTSDGKRWEVVHRLATPRFFHQLVPAPHGELLAVGGASLKSGHLTDVEVIPVNHRATDAYFWLRFVRSNGCRIGLDLAKRKSALQGRQLALAVATSASFRCWPWQGEAATIATCCQPGLEGSY